MFLNNVKFILSAPNKFSWPDDDLKEICILGKSNVGKSSFINAICNNNKLARISSTPGCTKLLNFYNVNDQFRIVDAPGYGYAKTSLLDNKSFINMMHQYIYQRDNVVLFILLVDSRLKPTQDDINAYKMLKQSEKEILIIATKSDKLNQSGRYNAKKNITEVFGNDDTYLLVSKDDKKSIEAVVEKIINNI